MDLRGGGHCVFTGFRDPSIKGIAKLVCQNHSEICNAIYDSRVKNLMTINTQYKVA